jgi:hypothetical protein
MNGGIPAIANIAPTILHPIIGESLIRPDKSENVGILRDFLIFRSVAKKHTDAMEYVKIYNTTVLDVEISFITAKMERINPACPTEEYAMNFLMLS